MECRKEFPVLGEAAPRQAWNWSNQSQWRTEELTHQQEQESVWVRWYWPRGLAVGTEKRGRWFCLSEVKSELEVFALHILPKGVNAGGGCGKGSLWVSWRLSPDTFILVCDRRNMHVFICIILKSYPTSQRLVSSETPPGEVISTRHVHGQLLTGVWVEVCRTSRLLNSHSAYGW